jgi:hypothetical protein
MPDERVSSTAFNFSPKTPAPAALDSGDYFNAIKTRSTMHSIRHTPISYHQCIRVQFNWGLVHNISESSENLYSSHLSSIYLLARYH